MEENIPIEKREEIIKLEKEKEQKSFNGIYEQITTSDKFKDFIEKNPTAELCAGFFIMDFLSNDNKTALDYKLGNKVFSFNIKDDESIKVIEDELMELQGRPTLTKINPEAKTELTELRSIAGIAALDNGISSKFNKIIAVLQNNPSPENNDGKTNQIWNLTCMLDGLIILNILIDTVDGHIIKFERKSMMDMIKKR